MELLMTESKNVTDELQSLKTIVLQFKETDVNNITNCKQLSEKYLYRIPLRTIEEFEKFEKELGDSKSTLRTDFVSNQTMTD